MRLRIKLRAVNSISELSINHHYQLSAAIYNLLQFGSKEFSAFLHEIGFKQNGRTYKLFNFALRFEKVWIERNKFILRSPVVYLYITSPLVESFIKNFLIGTFEEQKLEIYSDYIKTEFIIDQAELIPIPDFNYDTKFIMLSPMVLSTLADYKGKRSQYFYRYNDNIKEINRVLNGNLANKFKAVHNKKYSGEGITIAWDENYVKKKISSGKSLAKKFSITKDEFNPIDIIGIEAPFSLKGDTALMEIGYQCGFGEKNSMGFGMAEAVK
ncbi:MAG: CRISPR-associated endoribonuclease Cas6 [Ignavibacteriae bacterium]|nr:CRISPR-associated endoribonuclease Cas6 [Ignavibacteriota bacterium]NOH00227.1 CRISPR-associated endoribonuclease Cas6 [Ignavibacteriota bacterium]